MADWVEANLTDLFPVDSIVTTLRTVLDVVRAPLLLVKIPLQTAATILIALDSIFPPFQALIDEIEEFKNDLLSTGLYMLDMWAYPVKQLQRTSFGPEITVANLELNGQDFSESFLADVISSFDDEADNQRPLFNGDVAMFIIVAGTGSLPNFQISVEEDNYGDGFSGLQDQIGGAGKAIKNVLWRYAWVQMARLANLQQNLEGEATSVVQTRVERVKRAERLYSQMDTEQVDALPVPVNTETGESFFTDSSLELLSWEDDVLPIIESVEERFLSPTYPDWQNVTMRDIHPQIVEVVDAIFDPVIELLRIPGNIIKQLLKIVAAIQEKIDQLEKLIDEIDRILEEVEQFLKMAGFAAIFVNSTEGTEGLKQKLLAAGNVPFEEGPGFFSGMALLAGGPPLSAFRLLFTPIGG
jgi:hypothetical protein